jgi:hypothetical protein
LETEMLFGCANMFNLGLGLFMSDQILMHIVNCTHFYKITDSISLFKETC